MDYKLFKKELSLHANKGYHKIDNLKEQLQDIQIKNLNDEYKTFISEIGTGSFFNGRLQLFSPISKEFKEFNSRLRELKFDDFVAIGYDGTTEGCFCLKADTEDNAVYWLAWAEPMPFQLNSSFLLWIESTPKELFSENIYKAFKKIKDIDNINRVIEEREKISLELLSFDKELVAHPDETKRYLKRYNKVLFEIIKTESVDLKNLTIKMFRSGSSIGNDNIEYVTIDIEKIPVLIPTKIEAFLFDPFNIPFKNIISLYKPKIDLTSPMKVKYKEIVPFL